MKPPILQWSIPDDVVLNILGRLPVKSVIRFRCVSKSWDSSITTPYFISTHLNHNNNNNKDSHDNGYVIHVPSHPSFWWSPNNRPVCTVAFDCTFDRISEVKIPFDFYSKPAQLVGSCNGLLCLADFGSVNVNVIYLWNPSIIKFKKLPPTCLGKLENVTLGFAYHSENNDYKVTKELEVYTLSSDSWRRVGVELTTDVTFGYGKFILPVPLVCGALHWLARIREDGRSELIMAFDVNSERFRKLALPDCLIKANNCERFLASFKGKLTFITFGCNEQPGFPSQYSVWVMKEYGVVDSWNKLCVVSFQRIACFFGFTEYGSLLVFYCNELVEGPELKFVLVDTETLHEKLDIQHPSYVATFMESLILLDGANVASY
ncbi:F-box protein At3g07870-like [Quercus lobata]|uniref:F-box domain-containing protein n=1 Tax=Quercus lobata TaxID=97700 RepID=A0A7N2LH95_QUELO|nr:F-box protein At3g07870-like [Quercus lobata]